MEPHRYLRINEGVDISLGGEPTYLLFVKLWTHIGGGGPMVGMTHAEARRLYEFLKVTFERT